MSNKLKGFENKIQEDFVYKKQKQIKENKGISLKKGSGMNTQYEKAENVSQTVSRLIKYFKKNKKMLIMLFISVILVTAISLIGPLLQGSAIDAIEDKSWNLLIYFCLGTLSIYLLQTIFNLIQNLTSAKLSQNIVKSIRYDLFWKINNLSISYLDTHSSGDVMSRMTNDVENISTTISQSLGSLISGVLTIIGTIIVMFICCWQLTLVSLSTIILSIAFTKFISKIMRKLFSEKSKELGQLNGHAEEMITNYRTLVSYNKQEDIIDEFCRTSEKLTRVGIKAEVIGSAMGPVMNCISNLNFAIVAGFGGYFALNGLITIGTISAFIIYAKQFSRPINEVAQLYGSIQTAIAGAERVFEILDEPSENQSGSKTLDNVKGEIEFKNIDFSYVTGNKVINNFNLKISPGEKIAIVGSTGSGKTTIVNLLMRYYNVDSGEILIDGQNIMEINKDCLRKNIGIVLQDTVLFSDTIKNNVIYGAENATYEQIQEAAKMSNAKYFIERLPKKYDTYLKQAGTNLSQGQRQLLTIMRAILADPKILVLDEATSSVDTRTEKHIQDAMNNLMKDRTSIIIAHRLSTIKDANKIIVMDKGAIIEIGNHEELIKNKGKYYSLYMTQFVGKEI